MVDKNYLVYVKRQHDSFSLKIDFFETHLASTLGLLPFDLRKCGIVHKKAHLMCVRGVPEIKRKTEMRFNCCRFSETRNHLSAKLPNEKTRLQPKNRQKEAWFKIRK